MHSPTRRSGINELTESQRVGTQTCSAESAGGGDPSDEADANDTRLGVDCCLSQAWNKLNHVWGHKVKRRIPGRDTKTK